MQLTFGRLLQRCQAVFQRGDLVLQVPKQLLKLGNSGGALFQGLDRDYQDAGHVASLGL